MRTVVLVWHIAYTVVMVKKEELREMSAFSRAVSAEIKGLLATHGVTQAQFAKALDRNQGYVSERVNGLKAFDINEIDALAKLIGITGQDLLMRVSGRATETRSNVTVGRFGQNNQPVESRRVAFETDETGEDLD